MSAFRTQFKRLEAWLFQKPWLYGLGCFTACLVIGLAGIALDRPVLAQWLYGSLVIGPGNWLYAEFYQWRQRRAGKHNQVDQSGAISGG